ncbi:MAG: ACP S-malonyltransferase [Gammaproteobacteria bacterium]|nr:ACP S-malonyltransferase [Gammaproteobacteria bacterium]MDE0368270.1 ACP S-malonyltransferase [Gammaproteobacteria bacterium]
MSCGFVFPGQGSQFVGMLGDVAGAHESVRRRFEEAGDAIGIDLWEIVHNGEDAALAGTAVAQPALLTASFALWEIWQRSGGARPVAMAGHSLGEYSALVCAGAFDFADGVRLVHRRGRLMQEAVPRGRGAMAAILGLDAPDVESCCEQSEGVVTAANYNAPGQTVIAGEASAVDRAVAQCKAAGARRAVLLDVSGPFHCELMAPAGRRFAEALEATAIRLPDIEVFHNVDARVAASVAAIRQNLLAQLTTPVFWIDCVRALQALGVDALVECGPGKVLSGLARRIDRSLQASAIGELNGLCAALESAA